MPASSSDEPWTAVDYAINSAKVSVERTVASCPQTWQKTQSALRGIHDGDVVQSINTTIDYSDIFVAVSCPCLPPSALVCRFTSFGAGVHTDFGL